MVVLLKIKRKDFFQRDGIPILLSRAVKTPKFKLLYVRSEKIYATGLETCTKIYFLFIFNLVKPRYFDFTIWWRHRENHLFIVNHRWKFCGDQIRKKSLLRWLKNIGMVFQKLYRNTLKSRIRQLNLHRVSLEVENVI